MQNRFFKFGTCPKGIGQFEMRRAVIWRKLDDFLKAGNRVFQILIFLVGDAQIESGVDKKLIQAQGATQQCDGRLSLVQVVENRAKQVE